MVAVDHADEYEDYGAYNRLGESPPTICSPKIPIWSRLHINILLKQIRKVGCEASVLRKTLRSTSI